MQIYIIEIPVCLCCMIIKKKQMKNIERETNIKFMV